MNRDIRKITDGAMMAAIVGAALLINRQMAGILETMITWAFPLPMVFYGTKYGWKNSWMLFAAVMALAFIFGTPQTWFYVASEMLIGMIYGCGIHHKRSTRVLIIETIVLSVICNILTMLVFAKFFGYDIAQEVVEMEKYLVTMNEKMEEAGLHNAFGSMNMSSLVVMLMVLSTIFNGILSGYLTHALSRILLKRLRFDVEPLRPIIYYYPPKWTGFVGIACMGLYLYAARTALANETLRYTLLAIGFSGMIYLIVFGYITLLFTFMRLFRSKGLAVILSLLFSLIGAMFVTILGFMYITTDLHQNLLKGVNANASKA